MSQGSTREVRKILRGLERQGWRVTFGKKHYKVLSPDGQHRIVVSMTPSDAHALGNIKSDLRRAGAVI